jgi:asparagine synthase (glutamine-hydrolysing)
VITETVYRRQKHPFLAPPPALDPKGKLNQLLQDTLRGPRLAALPFYDPRRVVALLDEVPTMDAASQAAIDNVLTGILSACLLQERFNLGGPAT